MTVLEIVHEYLAAHGYDGLCNEHGECGCALDDLCPCSSGGIGECEAAHNDPERAAAENYDSWMVPGPKVTP